MGQFLKQTLASLIGTVAGLLLVTTLGATSLVVLLISLASQERSATVKDQSVLVFDLSTSIRDTSQPSSFSDALSGDEQKSLTLREVLRAINQASQDQRIVGIFLDGRKSGSESGYATLLEVREALQKFREKGKKIIAYDVAWTEKDYYLGSVADQVLVNPMGEVEFNGLGAQPMFWAGALDKYGIGVQVVRVGSYKSAVEPFTRTNLSPENRQQLQALLGDIWRDFLVAVEKSRKIPIEKLQAIADNKGILNPEAAKNAGLIDRVAYFDQVAIDLQQLTEKPAEKNQPFRQVALDKYIDVPLASAAEKSSANKIAIVYAEGTIVNGQGDVSEIGADNFSQVLRKLRQNDAVKAVVLRINSPGGSAIASDIILREIQLLEEKKTVVVSMGDVAASGGYWMATGSPYIFAEPTTITGSIGVFGVLFNIEKLANNNGITWDGVKTGRLANISSVNRPKTEEELAIYQRSVNQVYNLFLDKVSQSRNLPKDKVAQLAQGRVWSGKDAKKNGLVDEIGGLENAVQYAAKTANLGDDWQVEEYPDKQSWEAKFVEKLFNTQAQETTKNLDPLTLEFLRFKAELADLQSLNDPQGIYARLPFAWNFNDN